MDNKTKLINEKGDVIFLHPRGDHFPYTYEDVINFCLGSNTYRAFHKVKTNTENSIKGPKECFLNFLLEHKQDILSKLKSINSEEKLNNFSNEMKTDLEEALEGHVKETQLKKSFNKLRKPVDLIIEHIVALESSFEKFRVKLTPFLFLPLDSQMFQSCYLFNDEDIYELNLKRTFTFKDIKKEDDYYKIQKFILDKSKLLELNHRIYFDLIWGRRYLQNGNNLREVNP